MTKNLGKVLLVSMLLAALLLCPAGTGNASSAEGQASSDGGSEYHTPLAGEPFHTVFLGRELDIPARDRTHLTSLTLGGFYLSPKQGNAFASLIADVYVWRVWEDSRTRDVIGIFMNELEYDKTISSPLELVARIENNNIPGPQKETLDNRDIKETSMEWGRLEGFIGPGLRFQVSPFQDDNDLRLQLLGRVGYFYASRAKETGSDQVLPRNTMLYGAKLRGRYDGMRRNILELPHTGLAAGFDLDYTHRDRWADFGSRTSRMFKASDTRDFMQFSGYVMGVGGIPGLSEKNRVLSSLHGGWMPRESADRFSAFRLGGGPLQSETDDLSRPVYPGTNFNEIMATDYALAALEYRRELTFFMYLHFRGSFIWADRAVLKGRDGIVFAGRGGAAGTVGLETGFFWDSDIYLDYSYDSGFIRSGRPGGGVLFTWNKNF